MSPKKKAHILLSHKRSFDTCVFLLRLHSIQKIHWPERRKKRNGLNHRKTKQRNIPITKDTHSWKFHARAFVAFSHVAISCHRVMRVDIALLLRICPFFNNGITWRNDRRGLPFSARNFPSLQCCQISSYIDNVNDTTRELFEPSFVFPQWVITFLKPHTNRLESA